MNARDCLPEKPRPLKPQTVGATLRRGASLLAASSPTPNPDAQLLLAYALRRPREWLIGHSERSVSPRQTQQYYALCEKRAAGMPIAYITGSAGFFRRDFAVNAHVLVPRPETEHLVEDAIAYLRSKLDPDAPAKQIFTVFEAGVGSGAIGCTIAAEIPNAIVEGTDISADAVSVALHNARRLGVQRRCAFYCADVIRPKSVKNYDLVVANLPYVPTADVPQTPNPAGFEPRVALDGGPDGLDVYRKLLAMAPRLLRPGALLLMEAAPPTMAALRDLTQAALPKALVEVRADYAGLERYVYVKASA